MSRALQRQLLEAGVAQRVRIASRLLGAGTVSGEELARSLGVSRAAVHKHMEHLRGLGFAVSSSPGAGYRLLPPADSLAPEAVLPTLFSDVDTDQAESLPLGLPYLYREEIDSTNDFLKDQAQAGAVAGALAVAETQTAGRGRMGRIWVSEERADVTFSYLLRPAIPPGRLHLVVLAAAAAVAEAMERCPQFAGRVSLKWPNDVLIDGHKVCGILAEGSLDMDTVHWVVVGVGINVNGLPGTKVAIEPSISGVDPTSLRRELGGLVSRTTLLAGVLASLNLRTGQLIEGDEAAVLEVFSARDALRGSRVVVRSGAPPHSLLVEGTAQGLGELGELLVRTPEGKLRRVLIGEATVLA